MMQELTLALRVSVYNEEKIMKANLLTVRAM